MVQNAKFRQGLWPNFLRKSSCMRSHAEATNRAAPGSRDLRCCSCQHRSIALRALAFAFPSGVFPATVPITMTAAKRPTGTPRIHFQTEPFFGGSGGGAGAGLDELTGAPQVGQAVAKLLTSRPHSRQGTRAMISSICMTNARMLVTSCYKRGKNGRISALARPELTRLQRDRQLFRGADCRGAGGCGRPLRVRRPRRTCSAAAL